MSALALLYPCCLKTHSSKPNTTLLRRYHSICNVSEFQSSWQEIEYHSDFNDELIYRSMGKIKRSERSMGNPETNNRWNPLPPRACTERRGRNSSQAQWKLPPCGKQLKGNAVPEGLAASGRYSSKPKTVESRLPLTLISSCCCLLTKCDGGPEHLGGRVSQGVILTGP